MNFCQQRVKSQFCYIPKQRFDCRQVAPSVKISILSLRSGKKMQIAITISICKVECIFFLSCSTLISLFANITMFFFVEDCNSLEQKRQFQQSASDRFGKVVPITIHYFSSFKIIKSGLKRIYTFPCLKIKPLTQSANLILLKLFPLAALLFFSLMRLAPKEIETLQPYTDPMLLKPFAQVALFLLSHNCLQSLEMNIQSPKFQVMRGH